MPGPGLAWGLGGVFSAFAMPRSKRSWAPGSSLGGLSVMSDDVSDLNEKAREVANNLGLAMAQWGKVENEIYLLYCGLCLAGGYPNPCSVIYESLIHLDTKMAVVERLIEFRMTDPAGLAAWTPLDNRLRRKIKNVRNKLAHWRVWTDSERRVAFLGPPLHEPHSQVPAFGTAHGGAMSAKDLENHAVAFAALADDLREFRVIHASRSWP